MQFWSPTNGNLTIDQVVQDIICYVQHVPSDAYRIIIGSDSQSRGSGKSTFVTAIVVHRLGKGARVYLNRITVPEIRSLRHKIYTEAARSLETCDCLMECLQALNRNLKLEVHIDAGNNGDTRALVKEVVGWVTHSGFEAIIKPDSFGASKVADRYARDRLPFAR